MRRRAGIVRLAAVLALLVGTIGGCGPSTGSPPPAFASAPVAPASGDRADGSSSPAGPAASPSAGPGLVVDPTLLDVLPSEVDGVALEPDPTTAGQIAADPTLADSAEAIAVALAIRPGTSSGDDLAIASVIRLRPGVFSDAWFANWRSTYDQGACDVAGGVVGTPSAVSIAGRTAFVGTCAGDARTYHVHLADPSLIVSITAAGAAGFGELVVAGLAE